MSEIISTIFDIKSYMPHGYCLLWRPEVVWLHVISDVVITVAYFAIPVAILFLLFKRKQTLPFSWMFIMFALFIVLCGVTHFLSVVVLWYPFYYFQGIIKTITAVVSIATAILLFPVLPKILDLLGDLDKEPQSSVEDGN